MKKVIEVTSGDMDCIRRISSGGGSGYRTMILTPPSINVWPEVSEDEVLALTEKRKKPTGHPSRTLNFRVTCCGKDAFTNKRILEVRLLD